MIMMVPISPGPKNCRQSKKQAKNTATQSEHEAFARPASADHQPSFKERCCWWRAASGVLAIDRQLFVGHRQRKQRRQKHDPALPRLGMALEVLAKHAGIVDRVENVHVAITVLIAAGECNGSGVTSRGLRCKSEAIEAAPEPVGEHARTFRGRHRGLGPVRLRASRRRCSAWRHVVAICRWPSD